MVPGRYTACAGGSYGERPPLVIDAAIYPELEAFIDIWRAELAPSHNMLFTRRDGQPLCEKWVLAAGEPAFLQPCDLDLTR